VTVEEWALVACVVFTGLWSGLFGMLNLVMHPMLAAMSGYDFARFLQAFLPRARHAPFNYVEVIGMIVAPIVALRSCSQRSALRSPSLGRSWFRAGSQSRTTT
jgi:hypothetical protein